MQKEVLEMLEQEKLWSRLLDIPLTFDFNKRFIFKSLPAFIINQNLCTGQPIKPQNKILLNVYQEHFDLWKSQHSWCLKCEFSVPLHQDLLILEDEEKIQYLPKFIEEQYLFENELVDIPNDVKTFLSFYFESFDLICNNLVVEYFHKCKQDYKRQLIAWKNNLSENKRKRYEEYVVKRNIFHLP